LLILLQIVMARLVRATHDLGLAGPVAAAPQIFLPHQVFMGHPDKPGDDDQRGDG
jgi:hypothetical protein